MYEPPKPFDREEVAALMAKAAELVAQLRPVLEQLYAVNSQPGRPDWWRQIQKDQGQGFSAVVEHCGQIAGVIENHQQDWSYWMVPGGEGFKMLKEQDESYAAWQADKAARLAAEGKGGK